MDITVILSWYELVEQVAWEFPKKKLMEPFRSLLKHKTECAWSPELQQSFDIAKEEIVQLVENGVWCFMPGWWLTPVRDWSKIGVGYVL